MTAIAAQAFSNRELERYSRHLLLPEVGLDGQRRLKEASVLVIGAGGLGSPSTLYLAAAGVGRLGVVDHDVVDLSNLQRQILHASDRIGQPKTTSASERLASLNPDIQIEAHRVQVTSANAFALLDSYDIVVDGSDNFPTRYLINDACVLTDTPLVYGAIHRFDGQVSLFAADGGPCYRCLYSEPPPPHLVPSCAEGGVLGVIPGIIGSLQALEAIKRILGVGQSLSGRLLLFDGMALTFRELAIRRDPACPVCGDAPTQTSLIDYEQFCGSSAVAPSTDLIESTDLRGLLAGDTPPLVLDVRQPHEWQLNRFPGARELPLGDLSGAVDTLPRDRDIVTVCASGRRSLQAIELLRGAGITRVRSLRGGMTAWQGGTTP